MQNRTTDLVIAVTGTFMLLGLLFFRKPLEKLLKEKTKDLAAGLIADESGLSRSLSHDAADALID